MRFRTTIAATLTVCAALFTVAGCASPGVISTPTSTDSGQSTSQQADSNAAFCAGIRQGDISIAPLYGGKESIQANVDRIQGAMGDLVPPAEIEDDRNALKDFHERVAERLNSLADGASIHDPALTREAVSLQEQRDAVIAYLRHDC